MYAVVAFKGHQRLVQEGDTLVVDAVDLEKDEKIELDRVLLLFDAAGDPVYIGTPTVPGAKVSATVVSNQKGDKIRVIKFQGKKRYKRTKGFRPHQTTLSINKISVSWPNKT